MRTYKRSKPVGTAAMDMTANVPTRMIAAELPLAASSQAKLARGNAIDPNPEAALDPSVIRDRETAYNSL